MAKLCGENAFYKHMAWMFSGSMLAQVIGLLTAPVLSRLYLPEDFGVYQLFLSLFSILAILGTAKYEMAIVLPRFRVEAFHVMMASIAMGFFMAVGVFLFLFAAHGYFSWFAAVRLADYAFYLPIHIFSVAIYQSLYMWLVREQKFSVVSRGLVAFSLGDMILSVGFFQFGYMGNGLIAAVVFARMAVSSCFLYYFWRHYKKYVRVLAGRRIFSMWKKYRDFPRYMVLGSVVNSSAAALPAVLINAFWGTQVTGYYSLANQFLNLPISLASKSVGDVFKQEAVRIYKDLGNCQVFYRKNFGILLRASLFLGSVFFLWGPDIFACFLGESWRVSGEYVRILMFMFVASMIAIPLNNIYVITQRQRVYTLFQSLYFLAVAGALGIGGYIFGDIWTSLLLLSVLAGSVQVVSIWYGDKIALK